MGGRKAPDNKPRVAGPGKASKRTDLARMKPKGPGEAEAMSGGAYGERKAVIAAQQAIDPSLPQPSSAGPQREPTQGRDPRQILSLLTEGATQRPNEDIAAGLAQRQQPPSTLTAAEAAFMLEEMVGEMPNVSASTLNLLTELKREAHFTPQPPIEFDDLTHEEGPVF